MKLFLFIPVITILLIFYGCGETKQPGRLVTSVEVLADVNLTTIDQGNFYFPRFSPDGTKVFFTSANYRGLWYYDRIRKEIGSLNQLQGAGYDFVLSRDGSQIYFKSDSIGMDRRRRSNLYEQDIVTGVLKKLLEEPLRSISNIRLIQNEYISFFDRDQLILLDRRSYQVLTPGSVDEPVWAVYQNKIILYDHGAKRVFDPFNGLNLIWCGRTPEKNECLIYVVGEGLSILNRDGEIVEKYGDLRAARWSPVYDLIAYMMDSDDGMRVVGSDIYITTPDGTLTLDLTNTVQEFEMYPEWSPDGRELVYHTNEGRIHLVQLKIN